MIRLARIILFSATYFGAVMACNGAVHNAMQIEPPSIKTVSIALKEHTGSVLVDFDELEEATAGGNQQLSLDRLTALRLSIEELDSIATYPTVPPTQPSPGDVTRQVFAQPSGSIKASNEPPTEAELDEMERALVMTHLPGPPLQGIEDTDSVMPLAARVHRASVDTLVLLDVAKLAIQEQRVDDALKAQQQAREIIEGLDSFIP